MSDAAAFAPAMREAINLAEQGRWLVAPNPCVGAVLVRNGGIVASGWHGVYGGPHAERACLANAAEQGVNPADCTLVVTLEPCNHYGKTPPCTQAVLEAGIRHVVVGCPDPNANSSGGIDFLRSNGVRVDVGVEETACRDLIADFTTWQNSDLPYVILKMASTLDGRIATRTGQSRWISGEASRRKVHELRAHIGQTGGAVMVGGGTFAADNPALDARMGCGGGRQPLAVIVSSHLPGPGVDGGPNFVLLQQRPEETVFFTSFEAAEQPAARWLESLGVRVWPVPFLENTEFSPAKGQGRGADRRLDIAAGLRRLRAECKSLYVLCEGGGSLGIFLLEQGLAGEFHLHLAPKILADDQAEPIFCGHSPLTMEQSLGMRIYRLEKTGEDAHLILRVK